jgi:hypothetical protein
MFARFAIDRMTIRVALLAVVVLLGVTGCATPDQLRASQRAMVRALEVEDPSLFFSRVLARALGDPLPGPVPWQARQHYLAVIFHLEGLTPRGENQLKAAGTLGDAFVLRTLAQWRLGRMEDARASALRARASGQEALDARNRALFRAFEGVARLEAALDALESKQPYADIEALIAGESGAWRILAGARTELPRLDPLQRELIQSRLAAYKTLRDALAATGTDDKTAADEKWARMRAEAQVELADLSSLSSRNPAAHAALVERWRLACGLDSVGAPR